MAFRLKCYNLPDQFVRHHNSEGEINSIGHPEEDFAWTFEERGRDGEYQLVAIESVNFPGRFLRHQNFRIVLDSDDNSELFRKDSTFRLVAGLTGQTNEGWRSFQSLNYQDRFIRHRDWHLYLEPRTSPNVRPDATFKTVNLP